MIQLKPYQIKAVNQLADHFYSIALGQQTSSLTRRQRVVFKAPTGGGKTVIMATLLQDLMEGMPLRTELPKKEYAFIWISSNKLHEQSQMALSHFFEEKRTLSCLSPADIVDNNLGNGDILFLNWESVWAKKNVLTRVGERGDSLYEMLENTRQNGVELVVIIDEAHQKTQGKKCQDVLSTIDAAMEFEVSATPEYSSDYQVTVPRYEVVTSGMIKKTVIINPKVEQEEGEKLNEILIKKALAKRNQLEKKYQKQNSSVRPLLLIQLPNDTKEIETTLDAKIHEQIVTSLEAKGITVDNGRLAVWLSKEKANQTDEIIKPFNSTVDVLLFKQAIALGWDCPRAAVLLIFREHKGDSFTIQTIGRILRMPEQQHYADDTLNYGYVYTDLTRDLVQIDKDAKDYLSLEKSIRVDTYNDIELEKHHYKMWGARKNLGYKIRKAVKMSAQEKEWVAPTDLGSDTPAWAQNIKLLESRLVHTAVTSVSIEIPKNMYLSTDILEGGFSEVSTKVGIAKTQMELKMMFEKYCASMCGPYEKHKSAGKLLLALVELAEDYLGVPEEEAYKLFLYPANQYYWNDIIVRSLEIYEDLLNEAEAKREKKLETFPWEVPNERSYPESTFHKKEAPLHALQDFFEENSVSNPEEQFRDFLESNSGSIEWWYKNGDVGKEHFSVSYISESGIPRLFYVDFVIQFRDGSLGLFDTKSKESDVEAPNKHNAMVEYCLKRTEEGKPTIGGVIIQDGGVWRYSTVHITNTTDLTGWKTLNPTEYKGGDQ